ncbi:MAG: hypothetical protein ABIE92_01100 [bacterium]
MKANTQILVVLFAALSMLTTATTSAQPIVPNYSIQNHALTLAFDLDQHTITASDQISLKREIKKPESCFFVV